MPSRAAIDSASRMIGWPVHGNAGMRTCSTKSSTYGPHGKQMIEREALVNESDRRCQRLPKLLRCFMFACFAAIGLPALGVDLTKTV